MPYTLLQVLLISVTKRNPGLHGLMSRPKVDLVHGSHSASFTCPVLCLVADLRIFVLQWCIVGWNFVDGVHCGLCGMDKFSTMIFVCIMCSLCPHEWHIAHLNVLNCDHSIKMAYIFADYIFTFLSFFFFYKCISNVHRIVVLSSLDMVVLPVRSMAWCRADNKSWAEPMIYVCDDTPMTSTGHNKSSFLSLNLSVKPDFSASMLLG